jgi:hypothetical protein
MRTRTTSTGRSIVQRRNSKSGSQESCPSSQKRFTFHRRTKTLRRNPFSRPRLWPVTMLLLNRADSICRIAHSIPVPSEEVGRMGSEMSTWVLIIRQPSGNLRASPAGAGGARSGELATTTGCHVSCQTWRGRAGAVRNRRRASDPAGMNF